MNPGRARPSALEEPRRPCGERPADGQAGMRGRGISDRAGKETSRSLRGENGRSADKLKEELMSQEQLPYLEERKLVKKMEPALFPRW